MCVKPEQLAFISFFSCRLSLLNVLTITACGLCSNAYLVQYTCVKFCPHITMPLLIFPEKEIFDVVVYAII